MRISTSINLLLAAGLLAGTAATAATRPVASGKVNVQDLSFTKRSDAVAQCPGGAVVSKPDSSFACSATPSSSSSSDMAINEKGHAGNNGTVKTPK